MKTWHVENAVVVTILLAVWAATGHRLIELVGCAAVFCGFCHASIAERMREREAARAVPSVSCYWMATWFFVAKEVGWLAYFVAMHAWSALYKAAKALVDAEEPRERWVDAGGVTRLPRAMREELGVGDGEHIWFLRGPERWEAWRESELCEILGATSHDNACSGSNELGQDGSR